MAKKKQKKPVAAEQAEQTTAERKLSRKERLAIEAEQNAKLAKKRKGYYFTAAGITGVAVLINFWCNQYYGQPIYDMMQLLCFGMLAVSGLLFVVGSRYEVDPKQQRSKHSMGLVFIIVAAGVFLMEAIQMLMK